MNNYIYLPKILVLLCLFLLLFFQNVLCTNNLVGSDIKNNEGPNVNPWKEYMKIFDIPSNHGEGVVVDLGGKADSLNKETYRYATGKCPVFSKAILNIKKKNRKIKDK